MLDNLGFGEFFMLSLMALIFFGPERLPQIGAKLGHWIRNLTRYSKAFMTEWNEEALAIQDAVNEVKGIRDEIAIARAEIAGTLDTARGDLQQGVNTAREALSGAELDVRRRVEQAGQRATTDVLSPTEPGTTTAEPRQEQPASLPTALSPKPTMPPVTSADLERLCQQVTTLEREIGALRDELNLVREARPSWECAAERQQDEGQVEPEPAAAAPIEAAPLAVPAGEAP